MELRAAAEAEAAAAQIAADAKAAAAARETAATAEVPIEGASSGVAQVAAPAASRTRLQPTVPPSTSVGEQIEGRRPRKKTEFGLRLAKEVEERKEKAAKASKKKLTTQVVPKSKPAKGKAKKSARK